MERYPYKSDKLLIGAYDVIVKTEEDVKMMAEDGMNFAMIFAPDNRRQVLEWCYKYNIDVIFVNRGIQPPYGDKIENTFKDFEGLPNFLGSNITDEPDATRFAALGELSAAFKACRPDKYAYINLLPNYANHRQLQGYPVPGMSEAEMKEYDAAHPATMTFPEYLEEFVAKMPGNDMLSTDIYPFHWASIEKTEKKTRRNYIQGLADQGKVAREHNMRMAVIIQAVNYTPTVRQPSTQDGRYQAYASMAFGCDMMSYYTYRTRPNESGTAILDRENNPSVTYYNLQPVNFELQRISDAFMQYKSLGAFTVNTTPERVDLYFEPQYDNAAVKPVIDCAYPVLVGCLEKKEGKGNAYIILNGTELNDLQSICVKAKFPTGGNVTAYPYGFAQKLVPDDDGYCALCLESGQGVLVTVD